MDLSKLSNEKKLDLCRWYFRAGALLLPFLWAVNFIWFFKDAYKKPEFPEQKEIRTYVVYSAAGTLTWVILIIIWEVTFQLKRADWGAFADSISFIIPLGTP